MIYRCVHSHVLSTHTLSHTHTPSPPHPVSDGWWGGPCPTNWWPPSTPVGRWVGGDGWPGDDVQLRGSRSSWGGSPLSLVSLWALLPPLQCKQSFVIIPVISLRVNTEHLLLLSNTDLAKKLGYFLLPLLITSLKMFPSDKSFWGDLRVLGGPHRDLRVSSWPWRTVRLTLVFLHSDHVHRALQSRHFFSPHLLNVYSVALKRERAPIQLWQNA